MCMLHVYAACVCIRIGGLDSMPRMRHDMTHCDVVRNGYLRSTYFMMARHCVLDLLTLLWHMGVYTLQGGSCTWPKLSGSEGYERGVMRRVCRGCDERFQVCA